MKIKVARELTSHQYDQSSGKDYANNPNVPSLFTKKDMPIIEFAILPALPEGEGLGSANFLSYRDDEGDFTNWIEAYVIHEAFGDEIRNKTASPANWDKDAIDPFVGVATAIRRDKDLARRLLATGDLVQRVSDDGTPQGGPKVPWNTTNTHYMNVRVTGGVGVDVGVVRVLRTTGSALTASKNSDEGKEDTRSVWGLLDFLDQRNPDDESLFVYTDPTNPDGAPILKLWKCDPPTRSAIKWWRVSFTRNPRITISDEELLLRNDLSTVVNQTDEETSAKHFYEFCSNQGGLIDVMEGLYPQFAPLGRDRARAARRSPTPTSSGADDIPGIPPSRSSRQPVSASPRTESPQADSAPFEDHPAPGQAAAPAATKAPAATRAPVRAPSRAGAPAKRPTVGGATPVIPVDMQGEVPPLSTPSMEAAGQTLTQMLEEEEG